MPSSRPCAAFEPISPDFDIKTLVESTPNFEWVVRIHCDMIDHQGMDKFEKLVLIHVILGGKPLVVEGYDTRLDKWTFASQWLRDNCASKVEDARDLTKKTNVPLTIGHYLNHMALLTNQWTDTNYKDPERQRMYLKDIDCPPLWRDKLQNVIPETLFYLNESTGDMGGFGSTEEAELTKIGLQKGKGIGKAGDLMSSLPEEMRAQNLMCYIGHEGTYTPAHREMCASLGQNIMVEASSSLPEGKESGRPGSSLWFMTESKERQVVSEYWLSRLGHDIEVENHFAQINAWKNAPFKTYVVEQRPGDFILIPPLAPHQVWNRGTRTIKVAWNRTTIETLEMALHEALPRARMVCRDEQYKNKAIVYYTIQKYSKLLRLAQKLKAKTSNHHSKRPINDAKARQLQKDFRRMFALYTEILMSESFSPQQHEKNVELVPFDSNITCSYCRCNIFNRFLTCPSCVEELADGDKDTYDICMECYAMGRSCACISRLKWVEQFPWGELVQKHELYRQQILADEGAHPSNGLQPVMPLKVELDKLNGKRTLAQICQLELAKRPWRDITQPAPKADGVEREEEVEIDINGNVKKKRKIHRSEKFVREHGRCHVDCHWEPKWKQAECSTCDKNFCYGILFRAYDMMPQDIMANPKWRCPSCLNICGCRHCRPRLGYKPYTPSGTLLGHNTKAVADPRSVESLVDFSYSNIAWIQKAGDDNEGYTKRLKKRQKEAEAAKAQGTELGEHYVDAGEQEENNDVEAGILRLAEQEGIPIDPALAAIGVSNGSPSNEDEEDYDENPEGLKQTEYLSNSIPMQPQYVVPEGGVFRDVQHAYDQTEAITYDYPDPVSGESQQPVLDLQEPEIGGYAPVVPQTPGKIEMINRKRKRPKVDEGDRPYNYKKPMPMPDKTKSRQSLVVKLSVNRQKLADINKMALIAQQALNSVSEIPQIPAVMISSDLQALNTDNPNGETQVVQKKTRIESIPIDNDGDFTIGRRRDRRKGGSDGGERPHPDTDITRRQTRMQAVTYEEPSDDDEFTDDLEEEVISGPATKLTTMEQATTQNNDIFVNADEEDGFPVDESTPPRTNDVVIKDMSILNDRPVSSPKENETHNGPLQLSVSQPVAPSIGAAQLDGSPISETLQQASNNKTDPTGPQTSPKNAPIQKVEPKIIPKSSTSSPVSTAKITNKALAEAQANRRAKMAAIEWADQDDDSLDEAWPEEAPIAPPKKPTPPLPPEHPPAQTKTTVQAKPVVVMNTKPAVALTHLHTSQKGHPNKPLLVQQKPRGLPQPVPATKLKVSVDDWADSDSDDDIPAPHQRLPSAAPVMGFKSVNGHGQTGAGIYRNSNGVNSPATRGRGRGRGRGRPRGR